MLVQAEGAFVGMNSAGSRGRNPSLGTKTKSRLCFFSVPAKNLITLSKPD